MEHWAIIHWFELSTLILLSLNLWFVASVLGVLRETSHWLEFLAMRWDQMAGLNRADEAHPEGQSDH
jgi:hypothetical protein